MTSFPQKTTDLYESIDEAINENRISQQKVSIIIVEYWVRTTCSKMNADVDIWKIIAEYREWDDIESIMQHLLCRQQVLIRTNVVHSSEGRKLHPNTIFNYENIKRLCDKTINILKKESNVLQIEVKEDEECYIIGTLKGQFRDLLYWLNIIDFQDKIKCGKNTKILFLGNYVDYHYQQTETVLYLFCLKCKYPKNIFMLRGKHDIDQINTIYGFRDECNLRLITDDIDVNNGFLMYQKINKVFDNLSYCALINKPEIFCVSGGISDDFLVNDWIDLLNKMEIDGYSAIIEDLLFLSFNDCDTDNQQQKLMKMKQFCMKHGIKVIVRGKGYYQNGYKYLIKKGAMDCEVITLHSNLYYNNIFENDASIIKVHWNEKHKKCQYVIKTLKLKDVIAKCKEYEIKKVINSIPRTIATHDSYS